MTLVQCLTNSPTTTSCLHCIKIGFIAYQEFLIFSLMLAIGRSTLWPLLAYQECVIFRLMLDINPRVPIFAPFGPCLHTTRPETWEQEIAACSESVSKAGDLCAEGVGLNKLQDAENRSFNGTTTPSYQRWPLHRMLLQKM